MGDAFDYELAAATRQLDLARFRLAQYRRVFGGVERDLQRRWREALAAVRHLETQMAS